MEINDNPKEAVKVNGVTPHGQEECSQGEPFLLG